MTQAPKTIPLQAVRDVLMCDKVRRCGGLSQPDGNRMGRFAAYTQHPLLGNSCRDARRGLKPYRPNTVNFCAMHRGDLRNVLQRTRWAGLAEVRKTWGSGLRALQAEFADGVM